MMLSKLTMAAVALSGFSLAFTQSAYAYKVKKICEKVSTKNGTVEKCRWVREKDSLEPSKPADKGKDAKK
jgi:outer membrane murein-binding lipoprotein Lpp